ncbi:MAG: hypothetical protein R3223_06180 [Longimicrobiales bacterium]|nr:hypothetical protein [Longimicrobiales bacterium]
MKRSRPWLAVALVVAWIVGGVPAHRGPAADGAAGPSSGASVTRPGLEDRSRASGPAAPTSRPDPRFSGPIVLHLDGAESSSSEGGPGPGTAHGLHRLPGPHPTLASPLRLRTPVIRVDHLSSAPRAPPSFIG